MALSPGSKVGPYEIVAPLGAGGMGEVYRARDTKLKRDVAVKVLPADVAENPERLGRFEREAHLLASLNHPNIASIYGLEESGSAPALIMELVEGESLAQRIGRGPIPVADAIDIACQVAEALEYAHERGIIHRDLKPANIVVSHEGTVKVLDFGLAKAITGDSPEGSGSDATHSPTLTSPATRAGVILGTAAYMSPEQARGKAVDRRADIWAFGVVLFEMLTGRRVFEGETISDTIAAILTRSPDVNALPPDTPSSVRGMLSRCFERDPRLRLRDIGEARIVLANPGSADMAAAPSAATPARARRSLLPWLVAAAAVVAAVVFGVLFSRTPDVVPTAIRYRQRTFRPQTIFQALYSPDGQTVFYSAAPTGNQPFLFSLRPEYTEPVKLSDNPLHLLSISPKGELAVLTEPQWVAHRMCVGTLARMPMGGGAPREIMESVFQATWAPDGDDLAITHVVEGVFRLEYPPGKVLSQTGAYISDLRFAPDGKRIAYFEHPARFDDRGGVAVVDLDGKRTRLADGYWGEEGIAWSPDSRTVYFSAGTGYSDFTVYAASLDGDVRVAAQSAGGLVIHDISSKGQWLATRDDLTRVMMVRPPGASSEVDMSWQELSEPADLSRDGSTLLFTESGASAGNNYQVCLRRTDGSPVVVLGEGGATELSADGRWALAGIYPNKVIAYPTGAGKALELNTQSLGFVADARWLDNNQVIVVGGSTDEATRCYLVHVDGRSRPRVLQEGVIGAYPSPDGKRMLVRDSNLNWSIAGVDSNSAREPAPLDRTGDLFADWSADGGSVYVYGGNQAQNAIDRVDLKSGVRTTIVTLDPKMPGVLYVRGASITPDERAYAYSAMTYLSRLYTMEGAQ